MKKRIFIQGAFDLINWGHIQSFKTMREMHDDTYVIVALNTDRLIMEYKNVETTLPFYQRKKIIESMHYVDEVVEIDEFSALQMLKDMEVDIYCIGKEWEHTKEKEIEYMNGNIFFMPRFEGGISTSEMKRRIIKNANRKPIPESEIGAEYNIK